VEKNLKWWQWIVVGVIASYMIFALSFMFGLILVLIREWIIQQFWSGLVIVLIISLIVKKTVDYCSCSATEERGE